MRERLVEDVVHVLEEGDFEVSETCNIRPKAFDLVARRGPVVLFVKVLVNVDGVDRRTAEGLKALSHHLDASPVVVGHKNRERELEPGVLYLRRGLPAMNPETAYDYFVEGVPPLAYMARGGLYVNLDGDLLADLREERGMSLGQVANELGVSRRSVSKYEDGMDATLDVALRLEQVFDAEVLSPVDVLCEFEEVGTGPADLGERERAAFAVLRRTGFDVHPTEGAPFRAVVDRGGMPGSVLAGTGRHDSEAQKRARLMSSISEVAGTESVYLVESSTKQRIRDTVVIEFDELDDIEDSDDFLDVYQERSA